jgi:hypothetical protein
LFSTGTIASSCSNAKKKLATVWACSGSASKGPEAGQSQTKNVRSGLLCIFACVIWLELS